jgi:uncharacterized protein (TIGR00369 family)
MPPETAPAPLDVPALQALLAGMFAPWVHALGLRVVAADDAGVTLVLPVEPAVVHGGGVVCGQALMSAADTAMVLATSHRLGGFRPMTTVQLQTSFLRAVPAVLPDVTVQARVLKLGRSLVFGEVVLSLPDGSTAAHATTTYALL